MKIGPIDIGIPALVYLGGSIGVGFLCLTLWNSGESTRYQSYYREKIIRGVSDNLPESQALGINACKDLLKKNPDSIPAQFYMANIHALQSSHAEAKAIYDTLLKNPKLTALEKAVANTCAGVCVFHLADKDNKAKAVPEAETYFKAAIDADSTYADAHAQYALLQPFKSPDGWHTLAADAAKKALAAAVPPTSETLENLYRLQSAILQEQKLAKESLAAIDAASGVKPTAGRSMDGMRNTTRLASVIDPDMTPSQRRKQIEDLERDMAKLGERAQMARASIAIGLAWMKLKTEPDWEEKGYQSAVRSFQRALEQDSSNRLIYDNFSALYEMRTDDLAQKLSGPVTGFKGSSPPIPPSKTAGSKGRRFPPADRDLLFELRKIQKDVEELWKRYASTVTQASPERAEARARMINALRRQAYTMDTDEENAAKVTLDRALLLSKESEARDTDNPEIAMQTGMLLLEMKRDSEAMQRFEKANKLGYKSPLLDEILSSFGGKSDLVAARPADGQRWFGTRPLVSATLRTPGAAEGFRGVEMKHNGKAINGHLVGTQVLYLPVLESLTDGKHSIDISVTEALTMRKIDFPPLEFNIDKSAPVIKIQPESGDVNSAAQFNIALVDPTGIDLSSVKITFKSTQAGTSLNRAIVTNGRYMVNASADGIKMGSNLPAENFKIAAGVPLPEGGYVMEIVVKDLTGNETKTNKGFIVSK